MGNSYEESMVQEIPQIIKICTSSAVLTKTEEYDLIRLARPALKAQKILANPLYKERLKTSPARQRLLRCSQRGQKAQKKLLEHNYRLIISVAKKLRGRGLSWEDMIQHGSDGLLYAVEKFDSSTGNKLSTYATQWIRQRIGRAIENTGRLIRIPIHMQAKMNEVRYIYRQFVEDNQETPSSEEIAFLYNLNKRNKKNFKPITSEEAEELGRYMQEIGSLDETSGEDETLNLHSYISDDTFNPEDTTETRLNKDVLTQLLAKLSPPDQAFIKYKWGLVDGQAKTDHKVAESFGITPKEVKEKEATLLGVLRQAGDPRHLNLDFDKKTYTVVLLNRPNMTWREVPEYLPAVVMETDDEIEAGLFAQTIRVWGGRACVLS
jgi:RNA polymerase primary sigma factor